MNRFIFYSLLLLTVLVTANSQHRNRIISDRSSSFDQTSPAFLNYYYSEIIDKSLKNDGSLSARSLFRGPGRFLFWRFRVTTLTKYTATSTSTSTTTCTLSTSSICSGRRRRSSLLEWTLENDEDNIAPTNVLKIEATPEADLESIRTEPCSTDHQYSINSDDNYPASSQYNSDPYAIQSALFDLYNDRYNYLSYYGGYQPVYDSPYQGFLNHRYQPGYQQYPLEPYRSSSDDYKIAAFRRIFGLTTDRLFPRLFTTFTLTFTTTTGISTVFNRVTATSTPLCSTPGVLAQCPTG